MPSTAMEFSGHTALASPPVVAQPTPQAVACTKLSSTSWLRVWLESSP